MEQVHPSPAPAPNFVVKAEPIDGVLFDSKKYQYTIDLIGLDEIMISIPRFSNMFIKISLKLLQAIKLITHRLEKE